MSSPRHIANPLWYCVRRKGIAKSSGWTDVALQDLRTRISLSPTDVVEVFVAEHRRSFSARRFRKHFANNQRGLLGIELEFEGRSVRLAPTQMIARNLTFRRVLERFMSEQSKPLEEFESRGTSAALSGSQYLLGPSEQPFPVELHRASTLVDIDAEPMHCRAERLAMEIGTWMVSNQSADGEIPYKYWPSRGQLSPADNAIRRFLASIALARLGKRSSDRSMTSAAERNLRFNLGRYFKVIDDGHGAIVEDCQAKLGAAALAAIAIMESSARDAFTEELAMLARGIESLYAEQMDFRTFFFPKERDGENWNFYSGEALLFWATALRRGEPHAPSADRCVKAFGQCQTRHAQKRNPAFVPWHTQAGAHLFEATDRRELAKAIFRMNDWLLPMQQCDGVAADLRGRFYNPSRPDFGPPHAASTAVYLEGLVDALAAAHTLGEARRASKYERALREGFRSLRQLQFRGDDDTFYISKKVRVLGGLRAEAYDNAVRIDSAAHALIAALKLLDYEGGKRL